MVVCVRAQTSGAWVRDCRRAQKCGWANFMRAKSGGAGSGMRVQIASASNLGLLYESKNLGNLYARKVWGRGQAQRGARAQKATV